MFTRVPNDHNMKFSLFWGEVECDAHTTPLINTKNKTKAFFIYFSTIVVEEIDNCAFGVKSEYLYMVIHYNSILVSQIGRERLYPLHPIPPYAKAKPQ